MYKLSNLAAEDFEKIVEYTLLNFGMQKADEYTDDLHRVLLTLSNSPSMGRDCSHLAEQLRRHDHQKHAIFYHLRADDIYIVRILHQQMEPLKHFSVGSD